MLCFRLFLLKEGKKKPTELKTRSKRYLGCSSPSCVCEADYSYPSVLPFICDYWISYKFSRLFFFLKFIFILDHSSILQGTKYLIIKGRKLMRLIMTVYVNLVLGQVLSKNSYSFSRNEQCKPLWESITSGRKKHEAGLKEKE